jgi:transcriptional regulator with XRE-family HTH domain
LLRTVTSDWTADEGRQGKQREANPMITTKKAAAELIRLERKARKLKRATVAHRCGAAPSWLKRLESGKRPVTLDDFLDLADAIGFNAVEAFRLLAQHHVEALKPKQRKKVFAARAGRTKR